MIDVRVRKEGCSLKEHGKSERGCDNRIDARSAVDPVFRSIRFASDGNKTDDESGEDEKDADGGIGALSGEQRFRLNVRGKVCGCNDRCSEESNDVKKDGSITSQRLTFRSFLSPHCGDYSCDSLAGEDRAIHLKDGRN